MFLQVMHIISMTTDQRNVLWQENTFDESLKSKFKLSLG